MSLAAAALLVCLAQGPHPTQLALPSFRLHLLASEDLDPDFLRPLARGGVTLWLSTRSNLLRESTVENVDRFQEAWVQLRAPLTAAQAKLLQRAPRAGAFIADSELGGAGLHRLGPRRLAIGVAGALEDERAERLRAAHPVVLWWEPGAGADLLSFARLRQLPGRKLVRLGPASGAADAGPRCEGQWAHATTWWFDARGQDLEHPPCGRGLRARVSPQLSDEALRRLYRLDPAIELEVDVGTDERMAFAARELLSRLEAAGPHAP